VEASSVFRPIRLSFIHDFIKAAVTTDVT